MERKRRPLQTVPLLSPRPGGAETAKPTLAKTALAPDVADEDLTRSDALIRMTEAEDTLRAIAAGEVDAFVLSDDGSTQRVFTLSTADRPYRMFVENMRDGAATLSSSGIILYANRRFAELLSCARETIVGSPLTRFLTGDVPIGLQEARAPGALGSITELELVTDDGVVVPVLVLVGSSPLEVDGDRLVCLTFTDLSDRKAQEREIARLGDAQAERKVELQNAQAALTMQATHDALTGLPNRALLVDRIDQAISQSKRSGRCTAVFFVDLDRFKQINDTQGHAVGDALLQGVARQLTRALRSIDTVARIGGDEFVVLAPEVDNHLHAVDISARLVAELLGSHAPVAEGDRIPASIGVAVSVAGRGSAEILLHEADTAMYHAKSLGGGRAEVFDTALGQQVQRRLEARQTLESALNDRRVIAYYQPIVDVGSGRVAGFEALARIADEGGSVLPPAAFIPGAEENGLVVPLGAQVLGLACEEAHRWRNGSPGPPLTIAVNLSSRQFDPGDLATVVGDQLAKTGLDPASLHLELTESAIMDLHPEILQQLVQIRDIGVQIGLDDFGTGYASLTHLRRLPLSFVKIDQSFVQGLGTDQEDERIVGAVVDLAANLGLRSIGEGVETTGQLDRLRELGCDQAQGYLFARPMPADEVAAAIGHAA